MKITVKPGVTIKKMRAPMIKAWGMYSTFYRAMGGTPTITHGDSDDNESGLYYLGFAIGVRTREISEEAKWDLVEALEICLGEDYLVSWKETHISISYVRHEKDIYRASNVEQIKVEEGER